MIFDRELMNATAYPKAITATGTTVSQGDGGTFDCGAATQIAWGTPLVGLVHIGQIAVGSPQLEVRLVGADNAALSTNVITLATTGNLNPPVANTFYTLYPTQGTAKKRYIGWQYVAAGTYSSGQCDVQAGLILSAQTNQQGTATTP